MTDQLDLFDTLSGADDRRDRERAAQDAYRALRSGPRPDGQSMAEDEAWCGRCGHNAYYGTLDMNHDLGYCGCPTELDPTWSKYERRPDGLGWRGHGVVGHEGGGLLSEDELCDRWDRQYVPDCACGHPWGLHDDGLRCIAYCGCDTYSGAAA